MMKFTPGMQSERQRLVRMFRSRTKKFRQSNLLHPFDADRSLTRRYAKTLPMPRDFHVEIANYMIDTRKPLNADSVVYSFGILDDVNFEVQLVRDYHSTVYAFDPTPQTVDFMNRTHPVGIVYKPIGVWTEDRIMTFAEPPVGGSASIVFGGTPAFDAQCLTLNTIMAQNGHDQIDLLKMDIEGAALPVLEQAWGEGIYPDQVLVELERPKGDLRAQVEFWGRTEKLRQLAESVGYEIALLPRRKAKYYSLELLFTRMA